VTALTHRERVAKTLRGESTDRIARGEFFIADEFVRAFLSVGPTVRLQHQHRASVVEQLDLDIASVTFSEGGARSRNRTQTARSKR
jgi:hypothetical protein